MTNKRAMLLLLEEYGTLNFSEIFEKLNTGQTKQQVSAQLNQLKTAELISQHPMNKRYSLTSDGKAEIERPDRDNGAGRPRNPTSKNSNVDARLYANRPAPIIDDDADADEDDDSATPASDNAHVDAHDPAERIATSSLVAVSTPTERGNPVHPSGMESIDIAEHESYLVGNAIATLMETRHSRDPVRNLNTAMHYITREIKRLTAINP